MCELLVIGSHGPVRYDITKYILSTLELATLYNWPSVKLSWILCFFLSNMGGIFSMKDI